MHLFVDNLTNVDFSYLDPTRGLVGETWLASIVLEGALDEQGMVCDFGIVKKTLRTWLDETIDHCLLIAEQSSQLTSLDVQKDIRLRWEFGDKKQHIIQCQSPRQAITLIQDTAITPESVASWCIKQLRELLPETIDRITLNFKPEPIEHHFYHYSHGLKKHNGNCQRIAHGHRSTVEIHCNDQRDHALEKQWCQRWRDIYIGTKEDLVEIKTENGQDYYHFAYTSQQGQFTLSLPGENCYLIDTDSTVEFIAEHIATALKTQQPKETFEVKAFEGIGKGAIALS